MKLKKLLNSSGFFPAFLIIVLILLALSPFYLNNGFIGDLGDPIGQTIPNKFLLTQYLKNGILPLWNPFSFLGFPMLADIQVGTFYFPDLITFSIFSPLFAHNISILIHLVFAALGIFFLTKKLTDKKTIAITLSLLFALTGAFFSKIVYLNFLETISFIPWILLIITQEKNIILKSAILFSLMIFAGHPIAAFYGLIVIAIFTLFNYLKKWKKLLAGFFLALLIASIQIIPFVFLKTQSVRESLTYEEFTEGGQSPESLFTLINPLKTGLANPFDSYLHFGIIALILLIISPFFFKKFENHKKKIYLTGITLCIIGFTLSLGNAFPPLAKILYNIPIINTFRVPIRYFIIFQFGIIFSLIPLLIYFFKKHKTSTIILCSLIALNSFIIPFVFLNRQTISEAEKQYIPEIAKIIENEDKKNLSLNTTPKYFLSSSFFLFPNRHILSFLPNIIGYNPLILKAFHNVFPVSPVGAFENPNYFTDLYENLKLFGLYYYIFPTENFLKENNLTEKISTINFLKKNDWELISTIENKIAVWQNPTRFAYFQNSENEVTSVKFSPGKIIISAYVEEDDNLIINQTFMDGWSAETKSQKISPVPFQNLVQSYPIKKGTTLIEIKYLPKEFIYGSILTLIGIATLLFLATKKKYQ